MESFKAQATKTSVKTKTALANLKKRASKTSEKGLEKVGDLKKRADVKKCEMVKLARNPEFQQRSLATAGGTIVVGSIGGAFGCASGIVVGTAAGVVPALFTFGLSIPAGGAIGGIGGLCTGTLIGGTCGGAGGLTIYNYRIQIKDKAMIVKVTVQDKFNKAKDTVKYTITLARGKADERLRILQQSATDLVSIAKKRSLTAAALAKSKSAEVYTFATTTRAGFTTSGAVAGAVVGGGTTGALGSVAGAAIGVVPAIFTFGLSIPAGAVIGGCVGTAVGGSAGAVGGGLAGYGGFTYRDAISQRAKALGSKVQEIKNKGVNKLADAKESMRSAVTGSTGCSENDCERKGNKKNKKDD